MRNCRFNTIDEYDDISTKAEYADAIKAGVDPAKALESVSYTHLDVYKRQRMPYHQRFSSEGS